MNYTGSTTCVDVEVRKFRHGTENSWTLGTCKSAQVYTYSFNYYKEECCLVAGQHQLTCHDSAGNGWNGEFIRVDGKMYCKDFTTGYQQSHKIDIIGNNTTQNKGT